jgi:hypothetical protein
VTACSNNKRCVDELPLAGFWQQTEKSSTPAACQHCPGLAPGRNVSPRGCAWAVGTRNGVPLQERHAQGLDERTGDVLAVRRSRPTMVKQNVIVRLVSRKKATHTCGRPWGNGTPQDGAGVRPRESARPRMGHTALPVGCARAKGWA